MTNFETLQKNADYLIEVFAKQGRLTADRVWEETDSVPLAIACFYRDYETSEKTQLSDLHKAMKALERLYETWPDGEVAIKLTIKKEMINV